MLNGVAVGVATAFVLAGQNILVALTARRLGALLTTALSLAIALAVMAVVAVAAGLPFPSSPDRYASVAALAFFAASSFLLWYRALQLGPVAVVSPITATTGAVSVVFAVLLLGEEPGPLQWLAVPVATAGAVLASIERGAADRSLRLVGPGPVLAAIGTVLGSVSNAGLAIPIRELGPVQAIIGQRVFSVLLVWLAVILAWRWARLGLPPAGDRPGGSASTCLLLLVLGLVDAIGFILYAVGLYVADAWLVALISQSGRVFAVFGGIVIFGDRLVRHQWLGIALVTIAIGMVALP